MNMIVLALFLSFAPVATLPAGAQSQTPAHALLDVPYLAQTPELCGGAAVAMVLRYWGERQVFPQDFAALVVASERGIPTGALATAVRDRQWRAVVMSTGEADPHARIRQAIDRGQPLIALIEVAPRTYHYVVIVGATGQEVVLHDPARAPFRVLGWDAFDRASAAAGRWLMLVLPPEVNAASRTVDTRTTAVAPSASSASSPCDQLVDRGIALALGGDAQSAEASLVAATRVCPAHPAGWRELAGVRFSQSRWPEAASFAARAVQLDPADTHARELLATSRYLAGDILGALDAWTPIGQPRIDAVNIDGAERTPHPTVVAATGLQPRQLLTSEALVRAERRVRALPVAAEARVGYEPLEGGLAAVNVGLSERDPLPRGWITFGVLGARAAVGREVKLDEAGMLGSGERVSVAGRWRRERPRVAIGLALPAPSWLPGVVSFDGLWERQSYPGARETRRRMALQLADWPRSWFRWNAAMAVDHFDASRYVSFELGADVRLAGDRVTLAASAIEWAPAAGGRGFGTASGLVAWRSTRDSTSPAWLVAGGVNLARQGAPRAVWEGAGTGSGRSGLLRAHPLLHDQVLSGPVFGRTVARGTVEYAQPVWRPMGSTVSVAGFVDAAQAWRRAAGGTPSRCYVDAGIGLRVRAPGRAEGVRLDVAHGLRGGGVTFSVGVITPWPR